MIYKFFSSKKFILFSALIIILMVFVFQNNSFQKNFSQSLILNSLKGYESKKSVNCDIYFTLKDKETAEFTDIIVSTYLPHLKDDFNIKPNKPIIIIYPNKKEMKKAVNESKEAPMGAYCAGIIHILSPKSYLEDNVYKYYLKNGPVLHELVHYFIDEKTKGKYYVWFSEGAALYYEYKYLGCEWHKELNEKTKNITLDNLKKNFYSIDKTDAYRKSFEIIKSEMDGKYPDFICDLCKKYIKHSIINF